VLGIAPETRHYFCPLWPVIVKAHGGPAAGPIPGTKGQNQDQGAWSQGAVKLCHGGVPTTVALVL